MEGLTEHWEGFFRALEGGYRTLGPLFPALLVAMVIDFVTGVQAAFITKELSSRVGWTGINRKLMTILAVVLAQVLELPTGVPVLSDGVSAAFLIAEGLSVMENMSRAGIDVPPVLRDALADWHKRDVVGRRRR